MNTLAKREEGALALQNDAPQVNIGAMIQALIEKGVTKDNADALTTICGLYERMQGKQAEREFATAFAQMQMDIPRVQATKPVPGSNNTVKFTFAPYEEIMKQVQPMLQKHGFSVSFDSDITDSRVTAICNLTHIGGHSRVNKFAARIGSGPPNASPAQADGAASTYAKRFALCNALNIVVGGLDDDARAVGGGPIDANQVSELRERVARSKANESEFLKYAGAAHFEAIPSEKFQMLDEVLFKREVKQGLRDEDGNWIR